MFDWKKLDNLHHADVRAFSVNPDNENEGVFIGKLRDKDEYVVGYVSDNLLSYGEWYYGTYSHDWDYAWAEFVRRVNR